MSKFLTTAFTFLFVSMIVPFSYAVSISQKMGVKDGQIYLNLCVNGNCHTFLGTTDVTVIPNTLGTDRPLATVKYKDGSVRTFDFKKKVYLDDSSEPSSTPASAPTTRNTEEQYR